MLGGLSFFSSLSSVDGGNGNGWNNGGGGAADNYVLASDFATLQRRLIAAFPPLSARVMLSTPVFVTDFMQ